MSDDELDQRVRAGVLAEPIDVSRVEAAVRERIRPRHVPGWAVAAAAVIAMVAASFLSYRTFLKEQQAPPICVAAAQDHQREIVQGAPRRWVSDRSALQSLAQEQAVPVSAMAALETTGYHLQRGRLCFLQKQIFLHLVYTKDKAEFSVYLRHPSGLFNGSVHGDETLAYFETGRVTAVFVSHGAGALSFARAGARVL